MFEKEAEKYGIENYEPCMYDDVKGWENDRKAREKSFKDGAEFVYNKANEWHYVKDGDLPKKTDKYLVCKKSGYGIKSIELIQYNSSKRFWCVDCQNDVIAWKEIVLPELKESE